MNTTTRPKRGIDWLLILVIVTGVITIIVCTIAGLSFLAPRLNPVMATSEPQPTATIWPSTPTQKPPRGLDPEVRAYTDATYALHRQYGDVEFRYQALVERLTSDPTLLRDPAWLSDATTCIEERTAVCRELGSVTNVPPEFATYDRLTKCVAEECLLGTLDFARTIETLDPSYVDSLVEHERRINECMEQAVPELERVLQGLLQ